MKKIVVHIIPTYNERENIKKMVLTLARIDKNNKKYDFKTLIADDNSPDGTGQIVESLQKKHKNLFLISGKKNGLGKAMIKSINYAIKNLKADIVITNEADFSFNPNKVPFMLKKIEEGYDIVFASRHTKGGITKGWTLIRRLNHFIANYIFATVVARNKTVKDHNGAFRAVRVKGVLDKIKLNSIPTSGFAFFNYSLFKLTQISSKYYEFQAVYTFRKRGESKISFNPKYFKNYIHDVIEYIVNCFKIRSENKSL